MREILAGVPAPEAARTKGPEIMLLGEPFLSVNDLLAHGGASSGGGF